MNIKLLTKHHLEFQSLKRGCTCLSESLHVKMPHCWKSHGTAQLYMGQQLADEGQGLVVLLNGQFLKAALAPYLILGL